MRVAINGFGRIGRNFFRAWASLAQPNFEIVAINDVADAAVLTHLLQYDSSHGVFAQSLQLDENNVLHCGESAIPFSQESEPSCCPWQDVDIVLEATGIFRAKQQAAQHLTAGAKRVVIAAVPFDEVDALVVFGVNHVQIKATDTVISAASCTTHCLAPVLQVLHDNFGIEQALMTEIHAYTSDQQLLDHAHRDWRRARSGAQNIIPTTSSSIAAIKQVLSFMAGKIQGHSLRVPTPNVAAVDLAVQLSQDVSVEAINAVFKKASQQADQREILGYTELPLVSSDFNGCPQSAIFDASLTQKSGDLVKIFSWYDNEIAYVHRLLDLLKYLA